VGYKNRIGKGFYETNSEEVYLVHYRLAEDLG
jgi:hypothetical protein